MTRTILAFSLSFSLWGCAAIDGNFMGGTTLGSKTAESAPTKQVTWEAMASQPPAPMKEEVPQVGTKEVWLPGYYQPVAGIWLWHQGSILPQKDGYHLVPASYREEGGQVFFSPPRWRRADLTAQN